MRFGIYVTTLIISLVLEDSPPASMLHLASVTDVPSVANNLIAYPVRCGSSGQMFFRMYKVGDPMGASILELEPDKSSLANTFNFQKIQDSAVPKPDKLKASDFQIQGSTLYVLAQDADVNSFVLKFSLSDGSYDGAVVMERGFWPQQLAVFDSGGFIASGFLTRIDSTTNNSTTEIATDQYGRDGRLMNYLHLFGDVSVKGSAPNEAERNQISGSQTVGSGSNVYLIRPGNPVALYVLAEGGGKPEHHDLWSPGTDWTPYSLQISGERALVGFVHDLQKDGKTKQYVQYSLSSFEPASTMYETPDVEGAFGCTDWQGNYSFLITRKQHLAVLKASSR